jgi:putative tryptophan/tyrosine transport system permease protein
MIISIITEGLIYGLMALGVFITFRVLDFPDLTVDGSFPLGAALYAFCLINKVPLIIGTPLIFAGGFLAGSFTAFIHNKLKIPNLLAGILTMTMLYSISIRIQGLKPNISYLKYDTSLEVVTAKLSGLLSPALAVFLFALFIALLAKFLLDLFFHTDVGLTLGALGNNEQMVISQGSNPAWLKVMGVGLSNGLVALSGALASQYQGQADVNLGRGIVIAGLASVMIGEFVIRSNKILWLTTRVLIGSILFRALMLLARNATFIGLLPSDLQFMYGLFIIILLVVSILQSKRGKRKKNDKSE